MTLEELCNASQNLLEVMSVSVPMAVIVDSGDA
jgi:hypothetical protein